MHPINFECLNSSADKDYAHAKRLQQQARNQEDRRRGLAFAVRLAGVEEGCMAVGWLGYFHAERLADLEKFFDRNDEFKWHCIVAGRHGDNRALPILAACLDVAAGADSPERLGRMPPKAVLRVLSDALGLLEKRWGAGGGSGA